MNYLRRLRVSLAVFMLAAATMLFLDFTGTIHSFFGWVARVQFIPALFAVNLVVVLVLIILTMIFGRLYCSVICPLGLYQDFVARLAILFDKRRRLSYSPAKTVLRYVALAVFVLALVAGIGSIVALFEPYSSFGRIITTMIAPLYRMGNNALAYFAERNDSYAFYTTNILIKSGGVLILSMLTFVAVSILAWRNGRTYCNTICPVGTVLGFLSKYSYYKIQIDTDKCNGCRKCSRECKAACIDTAAHKVDHSRCVACFDCIDSCSSGAISYVHIPCGKKSEPKAAKVEESSSVDSSKRGMLAVTATLLASSALKAQEKLYDGGLAEIEDKQVPKRQTPVVPAGAVSLRNFLRSCTGCQLCVSLCPNQVLRPSTALTTFMQAEMSFEVGYCRPECNTCSQVCPTGAIKPIDLAEKSSTQIAHAVLVEKNCVVLTDQVECGNCAVHCPTGAITMVEATDEKYGGRKIPVVNASRCIGCGACEYLCPARPFSAIYVEGHTMHKTV